MLSILHQKMFPNYTFITIDYYIMYHNEWTEMKLNTTPNLFDIAINWPWSERTDCFKNFYAFLKVSSILKFSSASLGASDPEFPRALPQNGSSFALPDRSH